MLYGSLVVSWARIKPRAETDGNQLWCQTVDHHPAPVSGRLSKCDTQGPSAPVGHLSVATANSGLQVIQQSFLGVIVRVIEYADWSAIAAIANDLEQFRIFAAGSKRQDLLTLGFTIGHHAIEVERHQVGLHQLEQLFETSEVVMTMVQVVNDPDVSDLVLLESLDDGDLIFGFAKPTAMVVERDGATLFRGRFRNGTNASSFAFDASCLFFGVFVGEPPPVTHS